LPPKESKYVISACYS